VNVDLDSEAVVASNAVNAMILPKCRVFAISFCQNAVVLSSQEYFVFKRHNLKFIV